MEKIINPILIKRNLIVASLFVTSFEMLKSSIQDRVKQLYCPFATLNEQGEFEVDETDEYKTEILNREIPGFKKNLIFICFFHLVLR